VGFGLDLVEFLLSEVRCRQDIPSAGSVDSLVEAVGLGPIKVGAMHDAGKVVALD
jgi:hypothetical protein